MSPLHFPDAVMTVVRGFVERIPPFAQRLLDGFGGFVAAIPEHLEGIWEQLTKQLGELWKTIRTGRILDLLKETALDLLCPWPKIINEDWPRLRDSFLQSVQSLGQFCLGRALDSLLAAWDAVNNIAGRLSLWILIASVVIGAAVGALAGGVGAIPGAMAGANVAYWIGQGVLISFLGQKTWLIIRSLFALATEAVPTVSEYTADEDEVMGALAEATDSQRDQLEQTPPRTQETTELPGNLEVPNIPAPGAENQERRYVDIAQSVLALATAGIFFLLGWIGQRLGSRIGSWLASAGRFVLRPFQTAYRRFLRRAYRRLLQQERMLNQQLAPHLRGRRLARRRLQVQGQNHEIKIIRRGNERIVVICSATCGDLRRILMELEMQLGAQEGRSAALINELRESLNNLPNNQRLAGRRLETIRDQLGELQQRHPMFRGPLADILEGRRPAPPAKPLVKRKHGGIEHDRAINRYRRMLRRVRDVRKDQAQVNARGEKVSDFRPDLQWTDQNGVRHYLEVSSRTSRANPARLRMHDPHSILEVIDLETQMHRIILPHEPI